ncbi:DUF1674 domain-containing protein [uncultured Rhodoblastus sp.]|uniref:DUF1674 domain-containing protein n=1 Tax=uncultured Rhodoblastus sp. TaxID=543037 RepID=UPI0025F4572D|nr:DUF1674 domain-containing protein [uncultured Rhodoblastus sp.]
MTQSDRLDSQSENEARSTAVAKTLTKTLSPPAQRALDEAEERRREAPPVPALPPEFNGPKGPEPIRYGDWERKGIASDF